MRRTHQTLSLFILANSVLKCICFSITTASHDSSRLFSKASKGNTDEPYVDSSASKSSDLRALLPKPSSRPLAMDKFGRRVSCMIVLLRIGITPFVISDVQIMN